MGIYEDGDVQACGRCGGPYRGTRHLDTRVDATHKPKPETDNRDRRAA